MPLRYLEADQVKLQSSAPQFVEKGHCHWCNKPLTGKATKFCRPTEEWKARYRYNYVEPAVSECNLAFYNWWYSRPAYIRATFIRDSFTCQQCGFHQMMEDRPWLPDFSNLECDHIIPLARGGRTEMGNLQTLCRDCNRKKGIKVDGDLEDVLRFREIPFRIPINPLCGKDWLKAHLTDHTPKEIGALTIEVGYDNRWLPPVSVSDKRGKTKAIMQGKFSPGIVKMKEVDDE